MFLLLGAAASAQSFYQDPDGRVSVAAPAGWQAAKASNRAATATITKGKAFVNLNVERGSTRAANARKNYEQAVARNCPAYHELGRGTSKLSGLGLFLRVSPVPAPNRDLSPCRRPWPIGKGSWCLFYAPAPRKRVSRAEKGHRGYTKRMAAPAEEMRQS